ncbi:unnamed protein product [Protopolystoma xenopodis]|uniref:Uncharacterized protein n=1 Tax=Protopolystoma xenopodis TaxID=117903 RepID=A0A448XIR8_9PLAT|nr:unnamed protein product [Protopolystoma xenopodis]
MEESTQLLVIWTGLEANCFLPSGISSLKAGMALSVPESCAKNAIGWAPASLNTHGYERLAFLTRGSPLAASLLGAVLQTSHQTNSILADLMLELPGRPQEPDELCL